MKNTSGLKKKKLDLSKETIRKLTPSELTGVVGGITTGEISATLTDNCTRKDC